MKICCLDMEGVLVPEIWIHVANKFKMDSLRLTTRDIPDYDQLMRYRLKILKKEKITLRDIQSVIRKMNPLPGARPFLDRLRNQFPVIILSDTYYEFALPLIAKLGNPVLFCNRLVIDRQGFIKNYVLRQRDGKRKAVLALKKTGFDIYVAGDSFNDLTMIRKADHGILFRPPEAIAKKFGGQFPVVYDYASLLREFRS